MKAELPVLLSCETCRWWIETDKENCMGECRRHAPQPTLKPEFCEKDGLLVTPLAYFPVTWDSWFCGEWAAIPAPKGGGT